VRETRSFEIQSALRRLLGDQSSEKCYARTGIRLQRSMHLTMYLRCWRVVVLLVSAWSLAIRFLF